MDVPQEGGRTSRRRRDRRKTREKGDVAIVTKDGPVPSTSVVQAQAPVALQTQTKAPKVIIAPPKKKLPKIMLVPKGQTVVRTIPRKTFKAKQVKVTIDNTAKTQKQRRTLISKVDEMTDEQVRTAAVAARLSRSATVSKAPIALLRQMVKDYQTMKSMLL